MTKETKPIITVKGAKDAIKKDIHIKGAIKVHLCSLLDTFHDADQASMGYETIIKIIVQDAGEHGSNFAHRLTNSCKCIADKYKLKKNPPTVSFMTTASDGRQTATIQFKVHKKNLKNERIY